MLAIRTLHVHFDIPNDGADFVRNSTPINASVFGLDIRYCQLHSLRMAAKQTTSVVNAAYNQMKLCCTYV